MKNLLLKPCEFSKKNHLKTAKNGNYLSFVSLLSAKK